MIKIKVLQVNKLYYPVIGGVEQIVQQIAEGLKDSVDMDVLVCQQKGRGAKEIINGVTVYKAASLGMFFSMPLSISFFYQFFRLSKNADIIHIHMPFPLADVATLLSGYKGKVVLWWHSDIVKQKKLLLLYKPFMKWLLKRADLIMAATQGHIDHSEHLPPYAHKCAVIPFGVDQQIMDYSDNFPQSETSSGICSILYVGRLVYYKGCSILLEAFSKTKNARLTIAGDGPLRQSLCEQAISLGIAKKVTFVDVPDKQSLAKVYSECDFFVLPSIAKSEAFGIVQIEAMAFGKPVINTNLPSGVPYVSLDGITGLTVPPGDIGALATAMQKLIDNNDGIREKYGRAAYNLVRSKYSADNMLSSILGEYRNLLNMG